MSEAKKTKGVEMTDGNVDSVIVVAVDNGYADQKIAFWSVNDNGVKEIKELLLPSRAQMGAVNLSLDGKSAGVYEVDGEPWTVGRDVIEPETIRGQKYAYSELNTVLVNHSLIAAGFSDKKVRVATGLPFDHFFKNGALNTELHEKIKSSLKVNVVSRSGHGTAIIEEQTIYPESTAAFIDYVLDDKGNMVFEFQTGIAVVDIGGNTTDITYINPGNTINTERSGSRRLGVLNVRDRLGRLIREEFNIDELRDSQLEQALRTGLCKIFGEDKDVSKLIKSAKRESVKKLMNYVDEVIGDGADLDLVLFVGGGAAVLGDVIEDYPHAKVPANPQFANARGMLKYMTFID